MRVLTYNDLKKGLTWTMKGFSYWISKTNHNTVYIRISLGEGGLIKDTKTHLLDELNKGIKSGVIKLP